MLGRNGNVPPVKKTKQRSQSTKETKMSEVDRAGMFFSTKGKLEIFTTLKETVDGIEHSLQVMSEQYNKIMSQLSIQNTGIKYLKSRVRKLEERKCDNEFSQLRDDMNDLECRSRRLNLELHDIPPTDK